MKPQRLALPIILLYWLMLVGGLALFTTIRLANAWELLPLWIGALGGTALGQFLALRNYRLWVAIAFIVAVLGWCVPVMPPELSSTQLWMAFVPATLCGFWSLAERGSLAAFWFPTVVWMLSILDHTGEQATPDGAGVILLGALAMLFIMFLRLREARRVALWRTVAATPLATAKPAAVLREAPGRQLARGGWALLVSTITFAVTAWVAPHLWQTEAFEGDEVQIPDLAQAHGLPCCPVDDYAEVTRSRVSEYFDIGRGHDATGAPVRRGLDCQVCDGPAIAHAGRPAPRADVPVTGGWSGDDGIIAGDPSPRAPAASTGWSRRHGSGPRGQWSTSEPPAITPEPSTITEPTEVAPGTEPELTGAAPIAPAVPEAPEIAEPEPEPQINPPVPSQVPEPPPVVAPETPPVVAPVTPPPSVDRALAATATPPARAPASSVRRHRPAGADLGPSLLHWISVILAAALLFQVTNLALRPLRRLFTLRHLRRPFWDETIDQRVSNSWQLALVGLRDAGWRSTSNEAPREFARRVGVDGLERCATILERAQHGIAIDAGDLSEMTASADAAYRTARQSLGPVARTVAWIRWPLT